VHETIVRVQEVKATILSQPVTYSPHWGNGSLWRSY